jgi:hypothetical protein
MSGVFFYGTLPRQIHTGTPPDLLGKLFAVKGVSGSSAYPSWVTASDEAPISLLFSSETSESDAASSTTSAGGIVVLQVFVFAVKQFEQKKILVAEKRQSRRPVALPCLSP